MLKARDLGFALVGLAAGALAGYFLAGSAGEGAKREATGASARPAPDAPRIRTLERELADARREIQALRLEARIEAGSAEEPDLPERIRLLRRRYEATLSTRDAAGAAAALRDLCSLGSEAYPTLTAWLHEAEAGKAEGLEIEIDPDVSDIYTLEFLRWTLEHPGRMGEEFRRDSVERVAIADDGGEIATLLPSERSLRVANAMVWHMFGNPKILELAREGEEVPRCASLIMLARSHDAKSPEAERLLDLARLAEASPSLLVRDAARFLKYRFSMPVEGKLLEVHPSPEALEPPFLRTGDILLAKDFSGLQPGSTIRIWRDGTVLSFVWPEKRGFGVTGGN